MPGTSGTRAQRLVAQYLDAYILEQHASPAPLPAPASALDYCRFRVGRFQFAIASAAITDEWVDPTRVVTIDGWLLVPLRYRTQSAEQAPTSALDSVLLKGGRVALTGILRVGELQITDAAVITRGIRTEAPWIAGSLRDPPSFVLDPDALQLHFMRRSG